MLAVVCRCQLIYMPTRRRRSVLVCAKSTRNGGLTRLQAVQTQEPLWVDLECVRVRMDR